MELAPIRKSLLRRIAWFGGDHRLVGMSALVMFMLGYMVLIGYGILSGLPFLLLIVGLLFVLLWFARAINKEDPWMVDIYIRHVQRYKKYYPAHSDLGVDHPAVRDY